MLPLSLLLLSLLFIIIFLLLFFITMRNQIGEDIQNGASSVLAAAYLNL